MDTVLRPVQCTMPHKTQLTHIISLPLVGVNIPCCRINISCLLKFKTIGRGETVEKDAVFIVNQCHIWSYVRVFYG